MPMRQINANVAIYKINRCGFFTRRRIQPQVFSNVFEVFSDILGWVRGLPAVYNTATFQCAEDSDEYPIYCYDIAKRAATGSFGLVLWNKTNINNGPITAIRASEPYGSTPVEIAEQDADLIPGIPTYFWVAPRLGWCATIRFEGTFSGVNGFNNYVYSFMKNCSRWRSQAGEEITYWDPALGVPSAKYSPRFSIKRKRNPVEVRRIFAGQARIRKVLCKEVLSRTDVSDELVWQRLLSLMRIGTPRALPYDVPIRAELNYQPTEAEISALINHDQLPFAHDSDIGFIFSGDPKTYWLSGIYDRRTFPVTVESVDDTGSVFSADSIARAMDENLIRGAA